MSAYSTRLDWIRSFEEGLEPTAASRRSARRSASRAGAHSRSARYYGREATARLPEPTHETETAPSKAQPQLKVVTRRRPRRGAACLVAVVAALLLGLGVVCPMLVGSTATGVESQVGRLEQQERDLAAKASSLSAQVAALSAPDRVADAAAELGLGPAGSVEYLNVGAAAQVKGDTQVAGR